jgi:hypothetical protein
VLLNLPLSRSKLDRAAHLRSDSASLDELYSKAKIISMVADRFECSAKALTFISPELASGERYFLGLSSTGEPYFVVHQVSDQKEFGENFQSLRTLGAHLNDLEIGAAVHSLALSQWHQSHLRCSKCGAETKSLVALLESVWSVALNIIQELIRQLLFWLKIVKIESCLGDKRSGLRSASQLLQVLWNQVNHLKVVLSEKLQRSAAG